VRHAVVLTDVAVYAVRRAGEYAAPPRSRAVPAALTSPPSSLVGHRRIAVPPARRRPCLVVRLVRRRLRPRAQPRRRPRAGEAPPCFPRPPPMRRVTPRVSKPHDYANHMFMRF
jgi:hypothetical protein